VSKQLDDSERLTVTQHIWKNKLVCIVDKCYHVQTLAKYHDLNGEVTIALMINFESLRHRIYGRLSNKELKIRETNARGIIGKYGGTLNDFTKRMMIDYSEDIWLALGN